MSFSKCQKTDVGTGGTLPLFLTVPPKTNRRRRSPPSLEHWNNAICILPRKGHVEKESGTCLMIEGMRFSLFHCSSTEKRRCSHAFSGGTVKKTPIVPPVPKVIRMTEMARLAATIARLHHVTCGHDRGSDKKICRARGFITRCSEQMNQQRSNSTKQDTWGRPRPACKRTPTHSSGFSTAWDLSVYSQRQLRLVTMPPVERRSVSIRNQKMQKNSAIGKTRKVNKQIGEVAL